MKYSLFFLVGSKEPLVIFLIKFRIVESNDYLINEGILKINVVYFRKIPPRHVINKTWKLLDCVVDPLIPMSDQDRISPYNISKISTR